MFQKKNRVSLQVQLSVIDSSKKRKRAAAMDTKRILDEYDVKTVSGSDFYRMKKEFNSNLKSELFPNGYVLNMPCYHDVNVTIAIDKQNQDIVCVMFWQKQTSPDLTICLHSIGAIETRSDYQYNGLASFLVGMLKEDPKVNLLFVPHSTNGRFWTHRGFKNLPELRKMRLLSPERKPINMSIVSVALRFIAKDEMFDHAPDEKDMFVYILHKKNLHKTRFTEDQLIQLRYSERRNTSYFNPGRMLTKYNRTLCSHYEPIGYCPHGC